MWLLWDQYIPLWVAAIVQGDQVNPDVAGYPDVAVLSWGPVKLCRGIRMVKRSFRFTSNVSVREVSVKNAVLEILTLYCFYGASMVLVAHPLIRALL